MSTRTTEIILNIANATQAMEEFFEASSDEERKEFRKDLQLLADDPAQPAHVQHFCRAAIRGMANSRSGRTVGEGVDREIDFQVRQNEEDNDESSPE